MNTTAKIDYREGKIEYSQGADLKINHMQWRPATGAVVHLKSRSVLWARAEVDRLIKAEGKRRADLAKSERWNESARRGRE